MRYLRLGWVACRCIILCDDSPFAYIASGAGSLAATFTLRWCWGEKSDRVVFTYMQGHDQRESPEQSIYSWTTWVHTHSVTIIYGVSICQRCWHGRWEIQIHGMLDE